MLIVQTTPTDFATEFISTAKIRHSRDRLENYGMMRICPEHFIPKRKGRGWQPEQPESPMPWFA
jgi:hypothetical protein